MTWLLILFTAVFLPLGTMEFVNLAPWLAGQLIEWGSSLLGPDDLCARYKEDWLANLERVPGNLTKLGWAFWVVAWGVPHLRQPSGKKQLRPAEARMWSVLSEPGFRWYFVGSICSSIGIWVQITALIFLAFGLTHSFLAVGLVLCSQFSSVLLLGPWAGVMTFRLGSQVTLVWTQAASAAVTTTLACLYFSGAMTSSWLIAGAVALGFSSAFALPAQSVIVSSLVPPHYVKAATAANSLSENIGKALAPVLALVVVWTVGLGYAFVIASLSFLIMTAMISRLRSGVPPEPPPRLMPGFAALLAHRGIVILLLAVSAVTVAASPPLVLGPALATVFRVPITWYAYLLAGLGLGGILGSFIPARKPTPRKIGFYLGLLGGSSVLFILAPTFWLSCCAAVAIGIASLMASSTARALLAQQVSRRQVSAFITIWVVAFVGTGSIASLTAVSLAGVVGVRTAGMLMAAPAVIIAILLVTVMPFRSQGPSSGESRVAPAAAVASPSQ